MDLYDKNAAEANRVVARVMLVTFYLFTVVLILNEMRVFRFNRLFLTTGYVVGSCILIFPTLLNRQIGEDKRILGVIYCIASGLFVVVLGFSVSYHAIIIYVYPLAIAALYFSRRLLKMSVFIAGISMAAGQLLAHFFNPLPDLNFVSLRSELLFDIFPKEIGLCAISFLFMLLTDRTSVMLRQLRREAKVMEEQHDEMIMGFATLVENRDKSTGGHIRRTSEYVKLILAGLKERELFLDELTEDFVKDMIKAAPLHDIGKIKTPDAILQKPGKLSDEEYFIMKQHAENGRKIIKETFVHSSDEQYKKIASDVAGFHHEKWNGTGYPIGLKEYEIPLCARVMAVADVFDAISENRVYRPAMPMDKCFSIIWEGRGTQFDPVIVDTFMELRPEVERIHAALNDTALMNERNAS